MKYCISGTITWTNTVGAQGSMSYQRLGQLGKLSWGTENSTGGIDHIEQLEGRHFRWETLLTTGQHREILVALKELFSVIKYT